MLAAGVAAGCLLLLGAGQAARAAEPPKATPGKLWKSFPLEPQTTTRPPKPTPATRPPAPPAPVPRAEGSSAWVPAALGAGALVLLGVGAALVRRRATASTPLVSETPAELIARAYALAQEAEECDKLLHRQRDERARGMTEIADQDRPVAATAPADKSSSYADIGERVAGVLAAAETAALQIREDARLGAEETITTARRDADQLRREAETYDADTRAAVDSYASDRRREAEQGVSKQLADSEAQARATRQAAEAMAGQIEEAGRQRGHALREESKAIEERLKKALTGLRRMTSELEELLAPGDGETLTDALKPQSQRDGQPAEAPKVETPA